MGHIIKHGSLLAHFLILDVKAGQHVRILNVSTVGWKAYCAFKLMLD